MRAARRDHTSGSKEMPKELGEWKGYKGNQIKNAYSQWIWRQYASCNWDDIRIDNTLGSGASLYSGNRADKDESDEKHMHPLQLAPEVSSRRRHQAATAAKH